jgi:hypothetical protein
MPDVFAIQSHKIFENLLVMFRRNSAAGIRNADLYSVWSRQAELAPLLARSNFGDATFPKMRLDDERHVAATGVYA